ncbi:hypothetical protein Areg01_59330 [Actinoplanes regularis]|nr:hypothetical protein Areg01_59330 [Actinoplanes regularis]
MPDSAGGCEPVAVTSMADLVTLLRRLHVRAGKPSLRDLESWAAKQRLAGRRDVVLKRTTISEVLAGKRPPGRAFVGWFAEACGVPPGESVRVWLRAWETATEQQHRQPAPSSEDYSTTADLHRRLRELTEENVRARAEIDTLRRRLDEAGRTGTASRSRRAGLRPTGVILSGHTGYITSLAFDHGGELLASGSYDDTVRLWDPRTGGPGQSLIGHGGAVHAVAFSPDGRLLASAAGDQTMRVWDVAARQTLGGPIDTSPSTVRALAFSPDGRFIVGGTHDWVLRLWDTAGRAVDEPIEAHRSQVSGVAVSPDGRYLATCGNDTVRLWDPTGWSPVGDPLPISAEGLMRVAYSPDGQLLAAAGGRTVRVWKTEKRVVVGESTMPHSQPIRGLAFARDGSLLVTSGGELRLWTLPGLTPLADPVVGYGGPLACCPRDGLMAAVDDERRIHLWTLDRR